MTKPSLTPSFLSITMSLSHSLSFGPGLLFLTPSANTTLPLVLPCPAYPGKRMFKNSNGTLLFASERHGRPLIEPWGYMYPSIHLVKKHQNTPAPHRTKLCHAAHVYMLESEKSPTADLNQGPNLKSNSNSIKFSFPTGQHTA